MNFNLRILTLWLKNGKTRTINFKPDKVNVITGGSNTGKTAILDIFDYCFMASEHKISEGIINENVLWYGISFEINDKYFTLARKSPTGSKVSKLYYFSSTGEVPEIPDKNIIESTIKNILETEFSISSEIVMPRGGNSLQNGSKISLRYFLLFNTISQDIITNSDVYFDKQNKDRYREALHRIFDLSVGIDTLDNILMREKKEEIEKGIRRELKKEKRREKSEDSFHQELSKIVEEAKGYGLLPDDTQKLDTISCLREVISEHTTKAFSNVEGRYNKLIKEKNTLIRKIRNMQLFSEEYKEYKTNLKGIEDSLKPIAYINEHQEEIIKTSIFNQLVVSLGKDLSTIREGMKGKTPIDGKVGEYIKTYKLLIKEIDEKLLQTPVDKKPFENDRDKYIFLGETKAKLNLYAPNEVDTEAQASNVLSDLKLQLQELDVTDVSQSKYLFTKMLEEIIVDYIDLVKSSLGNYGNYQPVFNFKEKKLDLRAPKSDLIENVGSSSNHMFLHLFHFLGLHEVIMRKNIPYIPSFLIIDQPSRPYYGDEKPEEKVLSQSDESKIKDAFKLFDNFLANMKEETNKPFQIIVFEHVPPRIWKQLDNIHLVEEFRDGNALIPDSYL